MRELRFDVKFMYYELMSEKLLKENWKAPAPDDSLLFLRVLFYDWTIELLKINNGLDKKEFKRSF